MLAGWQRQLLFGGHVSPQCLQCHNRPQIFARLCVRRYKIVYSGCITLGIFRLLTSYTPVTRETPKNFPMEHLPAVYGCIRLSNFCYYYLQLCVLADFFYGNRCLFIVVFAITSAVMNKVEYIRMRRCLAHLTLNCYCRSMTRSQYPTAAW